MARVKGKDTKPEMTVRRLVHAMGHRYRLHRRDLPGSPDLVFGPKRKAIFVHGCFWHAHRGCSRARIPEANRDYWAAKLARNAERDAAALASLQADGWSALTIWECETADVDALTDRLERFLD